MKTATISEILKSELLVVELPEGWYYNVYADAIVFCNEHSVPVKRIEGDFIEVGSPDEIKEEDARELVNSKKVKQSWDDKITICYIIDGKVYETAKEALLSAIETKIHWDVNPYAKPEKFINEFDNPCYELWNTAESRTFDRKISIILKKNK